MMTQRIYVALLTGLWLGGCTAGFDLQGKDPVAFYEQHPVKNKVEDRVAVADARFSGSAVALSSEESAKLAAALKDISPTSVSQVEVQMDPVHMANMRRQQSLTRWLKARGYRTQQIAFVPTRDLVRNEVKMIVNYAVVVPPHCPDWRRSSVTTYSNSGQGNFGCASAVNLGAMVADPHDLVEGRGNITPDTERTAQAVRDYRNSGGGTTSSSSTDSGDAAVSAAPQ